MTSSASNRINRYFIGATPIGGTPASSDLDMIELTHQEQTPLRFGNLLFGDMLAQMHWHDSRHTLNPAINLEDSQIPSVEGVNQEIVAQIDCFQQKSPRLVYFHFPKTGRSLTQEETAAIHKHYSVENAAEVYEFLGKNEFLLAPLLEAVRHIRKHYNTENLHLEMKYSPESTQSVLMLYIVTKLSAEEALSKLDMLDEQWWLSKLNETKNRLCIHLDYEQV